MRAVILAVAMACPALGCGVDGSNPFSLDHSGDGGNSTSGVSSEHGTHSDGVRDPLACGGSQAKLMETRADLLVIVDRSGSMQERGSDGVSKWEAIVGALGTTLKDIQTRIPTGLMLFPKVGTMSGYFCGDDPEMDVPIRLSNADEIQKVLNDGAAYPEGLTPTSAALESASRYLERLDPQVQHYIVLATDGAPNCNAMIDPGDCTCTLPAPECSVGIDGNTQQMAAQKCLDDMGTVSTIRDLAKRGIQTIVIGLPGVEGFGSVLQAMADAGGRPRSDQTHYYNPTSRDELASALSSITSSLATCTFHLMRGPQEASSQLSVQLGGRSVPRDTKRSNGWDWADATHQDIVFYGKACDQIRHVSGTLDLVAAFDCPSPG